MEGDGPGRGGVGKKKINFTPFYIQPAVNS